MTNLQAGTRPANPAPRVPPAPNSLAAKYRRLAPSAVIAAAEAFLLIGGRLMIDPRGKFEEAINLDLLFGLQLSDDRAEANMSVARVYDRARSRRGAVLTLKAMVRQRGTATANGWIVLRGSTAK